MKSGTGLISGYKNPQYFEAGSACLWVVWERAGLTLVGRIKRSCTSSL